MSANWSGGPAGSFGSSFGAGLGVANNQQLLAAPGAGLSIYLQTLSLRTEADGLTATSDFKINSGGVRFYVVRYVNGANITFPGGFRLSANGGLFVDVFVNNQTIAGTYTVGPTI